MDKESINDKDDYYGSHPFFVDNKQKESGAPCDAPDFVMGGINDYQPGFCVKVKPLSL